ncbi:NACHT and WD repeat domain-containing protein 2-like [Lithobates pipiens]
MEDNERIHKAILEGNFDRIPTRQQRLSVKIFLCADPLESEWERAALRTDVYPKLREYCRHKYGLEFQVLDGYDGIHPDDLYSAKIRKIRHQLLEECMKTSAGPCFVISYDMRLD